MKAHEKCACSVAAAGMGTGRNTKRRPAGLFVVEVLGEGRQRRVDSKRSFVGTSFRALHIRQQEDRSMPAEGKKYNKYVAARSKH